MGIMIKVPGVDYTSKNLGTATPSNTLPIEVITIAGEDTVTDMGVYRAKLYPVFTTQRAVVWSIVSGGTYATIDQDGLVTALTGASADSVTIRCTSSADSSIYAEKTITVTESGSMPTICSTILFDGASAIDTGILASSATEIQVTLAECNPSSWGIVSGSSRNSTIIGGRESSSSKRRDIQLSTSNVAYIQTIGYGVGSTSTNKTVSLPKGDELYIAQGSTYCQYNSTTAVITVGSFDSTAHYIIGAQNNNGTIVYTYASHDKYKRVKIYQTEGGTLLGDFVPAILNGTPGMYDYVSGNFLTNIGTGTLTVE